MTPDVFIFWLLAGLIVLCSLSVVLFVNPIYSALSLVMTMVSISALFVTLGAHFLAGVQMIVYAGAVMVLFVMVLMLFDLKSEIYAFSRGRFSVIFKLISLGTLAGLFVGAILQVNKLTAVTPLKENSSALGAVDSVKALGFKLFTKYVFAFEALGVLLLVIAIGTVALSRSKGGTHAQ